MLNLLMHLGSLSDFRAYSPIPLLLQLTTAHFAHALDPRTGLRH
jgi:hypothetical protein